MSQQQQNQYAEMIQKELQKQSQPNPISHYPDPASDTSMLAAKRAAINMAQYDGGATMRALAQMNAMNQRETPNPSMLAAERAALGNAMNDGGAGMRALAEMQAMSEGQTPQQLPTTSQQQMMPRSYWVNTPGSLMPTTITITPLGP